MFCHKRGVASLYSVLARTSKGGGHDGLSFSLWSAIGRRIHRRTENKLGLRGSNTTEVILDHVRVPTQNLLGEEGKGSCLP